MKVEIRPVMMDKYNQKVTKNNNQNYQKKNTKKKSVSLLQGTCQI